jgi:hypothetical protein
MDSALDLVLTPTVDSSASKESIWPLPGTRSPNAHLTWAEWIAMQHAVIANTAHVETDGVAALAQDHPEPMPAMVYPARVPEPGQAWPLLATQMPHARLTWTEWLEAQANGATAQTPELAVFRRAS